jgi:hypothetical protein
VVHHISNSLGTLLGSLTCPMQMCSDQVAYAVVTCSAATVLRQLDSSVRVLLIDI